MNLQDAAKHLPTKSKANAAANPAPADMITASYLLLLGYSPPSPQGLAAAIAAGSRLTSNFHPA